MKFFVAEPPEILPLKFGKEVFDEGDFAQVTCIVTKGDFPLSIHWSINGDAVDSVESIFISPVGSRASYLYIYPVSHKHRGFYSCHVTNEAGTASASAILRVKG